MTNAQQQAQAQAQYETILELLEIEDAEKRTESITESALSIDVSSGWQSVGDNLTASEYRILLCTSDPFVQITGQLNQRCNEPATAYLQYQDFGTPWTNLFSVEEEKLLEFANYFYFGE